MCFDAMHCISSGADHLTQTTEDLVAGKSSRSGVVKVRTLNLHVDVPQVSGLQLVMGASELE